MRSLPRSGPSAAARLRVKAPRRTTRRSRGSEASWSRLLNEGHGAAQTARRPLLVRPIRRAGYGTVGIFFEVPVTARSARPNSTRTELEDVEETLRALLLLALTGDGAAYAAFLTQSGAHLRAYFRRRLVTSPNEVEDLVQETLLALHNRRHTYQTTQRLTPWLYAIARYKLVDLLRAQSPRRQLEVSLDDDDEGASE